MRDQMSNTTLSGLTVRRGESDYEDRRQRLSWNLRIPERFPALIVDVKTPADAAHAVAYANENDLTVAVLSSGHSYVGSGIRDDALVLDMSALNSISVDVDNLTAVVGPGVKSRDLAAHLADFNLAFPVGHCGGVAMGGFLLAGGLGINWTDWGPSCFLVRGIEMICPDGEVRYVDDSSDPDLMWLARGCGPSFPGVITGYHIDLKPEPVVATSTYLFPAEVTEDVTAWLDALRPTLRTSVEVLISNVGSSVSEQLGVPGDVAARYVLVAGVAYEGSAAEAAIALQPLQAGPAHFAAVVAEHAAPQRFKDVLALGDILWPDGTRLQADTAWTDVDISRSFGAMTAHAAAGPSTKTLVLGVLPSGRPFGDANFSMVRKTLVVLYASYDSDADDARASRWVSEGIELLRPILAGHWLGESDLSAGPDRVRNSFAPENWERARKIRAAYDPRGRFADYLSF